MMACKTNFSSSGASPACAGSVSSSYGKRMEIAAGAQTLRKKN